MSVGIRYQQSIEYSIEDGLQQSVQQIQQTKIYEN